MALWHRLPYLAYSGGKLFIRQLFLLMLYGLVTSPIRETIGLRRMTLKNVVS